jgi:hypothetical protein
MRRNLIVIIALLLTTSISGPVFAVERGDRGSEVSEVQTILASFHYSVTVDGVYGPATERAVRSWQTSNGLQVDGIAGPATIASLRSAVRRSNATQVTATLPPPAPAPEHYDQWVRLAVCESGSRWSYNGGSGFDGGLQFSPGTWTAMGGGEFAQYAWGASAVEQMIVAERVLDAQGWRAWPTCSRRLGLR